MKNFYTIIFSMWLSACSDKVVQIPISNTLYADLKPLESYVWVGKGEAYIMKDGKWLRQTNADYDFSVVQRRFEDRWLSIKNQVRSHPNYDLSAGPRTQTHIFKIDYDLNENQNTFKLESTYGDGFGLIDKMFKYGEMEFAAKDISKWAPFSHYRISQNYLYDQGVLKETVLLFKRDKEQKETSFVKIKETAKLSKLKSKN